MSTTDATIVLDNRVNVSSTYTQLVPYTGQNVNQFEVPADGGPNFPNQIYFNNVVTPGGLNSTLVGRNIRIRYTVTIVSPSNGGNTIGLPQNPFTSTNAPTAAFRSFPLNSICDTITVQVNGASTTCNTRQILGATQRFISKDYLRREGLEGPVMADNRALLLADQVLTAGNAAGGSPTALNPVSNQPLSRYENSNGGTRGSFLPLSYTNPAGTTATWVFEISEPIMVSPFVLWDNDVFLGQLNTLSIQANYSSTADMIVSSKAYDAITSISITNPRLEMCYIQTEPSLVNIGRTLKYDYENVVYFPQTYTLLTGAATAFSTQFDTQTLRLQTMPKMIYAFARNQISARAGGVQPDCFYGIGNATGSAGLSIQIGTRTGLMASASTKTIYRMACDNGYNSTFEDYTYGSGSIIAIDPVKQLGINLASDSIPGMVGGNVNLQMSFQINSKPQEYAGVVAQIPATIEILIVVVYGGNMTIQADTALFNLGTLTETEVDSLLRRNKSMVGSEAVASTIPEGRGLFAKGKTLVGHGQAS